MLKRLIRSGPVQGALGVLAAAYMAFVARTTRWRVEGAETAESVLGSGGVCVAVWHGRLGMLYAVWRRFPVAAPAMLISLSPDGGFVARAADVLGVRVIRGSTRRADRAQKHKGGEDAYRRMIEHVSQGGVLCMTPDGPRGPRMRASAGAPRLARQTQVPTLCLGVSVKRRLVLNSWDRLVIPLPFGPGAIVWEGPVAPPPADGGPEDVERAREATEALLTAATRRADALAGAPAIDPAPASLTASA